MITYDFESSISYWVGLTSHVYEVSLNRELAGTGITIRQVQVLACLALSGEMVQNELGELMRIEPSTLVRILDRMERDCWISREAAPNDRRKKIIVATEKAASKWKKIVECGERMEKRSIVGLSQTQLTNLKETLETIRKNLGSEI